MGGVVLSAGRSGSGGVLGSLLPPQLEQTFSAGIAQPVCRHASQAIFYPPAIGRSMIATRLSTFNNIENKKPIYPSIILRIKQKREDFLSYPLEQILSSGKPTK